MKSIKSYSEILSEFIALRDSAKAKLAQAIQENKRITFWKNRLAMREGQVIEWQNRVNQESTMTKTECKAIVLGDITTIWRNIAGLRCVLRGIASSEEIDQTQHFLNDAMNAVVRENPAFVFKNLQHAMHHLDKAIAFAEDEQEDRSAIKAMESHRIQIITIIDSIRSL